MITAQYFSLIVAALDIIAPVKAAAKAATFERIITNYEDVLDGVPVDYRYNESSSSNGELNSVPGCPKSVEGYPWVYFGTPSKARCYLAGERGPCHFNQRIFIEKESPFGFCNCECFQGIGRRNGNGPQFCDEGRNEFVFIPEEKKCYQIYDQGPCDNENEWLAKVKVELPSKQRQTVYNVQCEKRKCPPGQLPSTTQEEDLKKYAADQKKSSCYYPFAAYGGAPVSILPNDCKTFDMKYSELLKKCIPKFNFNF